MAQSFLDKTGLDALWGLIKAVVNTLVEMVNGKADKSHTHTVSQITDLQVGGRNLLTGTSNELKQVTTNNYGYNVGNVVAEPNATYTYRAYVKVPADSPVSYGAYFTFFTKTSFKQFSNQDVKIMPGEEGYTTITTTSPADATYIRCDLRQYNKDSGKDQNINGLTLQVKEQKLEKGTVPTDWTPAPEDVEATTTTMQNAIERLGVQPHVELVCMAKQLYIVCDKGYIKSTDSVVLFRYVRSHNRYTPKNSVKKYRRIVGWKEPQQGVNKIKLLMRQDTTLALSKTKDVWMVCGSLGGAGATPPIMVIFKFYDTLGNNDTNADKQFYLFNKKCGIRIRRDGEWITDYLPFMARKTKDGQGGYDYGIGRWRR